MSCHCCPCDHSSTIRQYFSNINLWSNSKVTQLDRQSDNTACYPSSSDGSVIKEQRTLQGAVHDAETFSFSNISKFISARLIYQKSLSATYSVYPSCLKINKPGQCCQQILSRAQRMCVSCLRPPCHLSGQRLLSLSG